MSGTAPRSSASDPAVEYAVTRQPGDGHEPARPPVARMLDLALYAPLGFALEFRRLVPELVDAGRRQVEFSRTLGRTALRAIARSGTVSGASSRQPVRPEEPTTGESHPTSDTGTGEGVEVVPAAILGYRDMTAKQVIEVVRTATGVQLEWMRTSELAGKNRKTVLDAIERSLARRG